MIRPEIIKAKGFWKSVTRVSLTFVFVMLVFRIGIVYQFDFSKFAQTELSRDKIFMFFVSNILVWIIVGFLLTYFKFKKKIKEK